MKTQTVRRLLTALLCALLALGCATAAEAAAGADKPMAYLNRILREYAEKGIRTREQIDADRTNRKEQRNSDRKGKPAGKVAAQQYAQRDYSGAQETPEQMMARLMAAQK